MTGSGCVGRARIVLGNDIGNSGGLALVTVDGDIAGVQAMPVLNDGPKGRPTINAVLLADLVRRWARSAAYVELVGPRPGEAAGGAFCFGRARGLVEGVLAAEAVPSRHLTPATWKRALGIPADKGMKGVARSLAIERWPTHAESFARVMDHDRAEAALIGWAGLQRERAGR